MSPRARRCQGCGAPLPQSAASSRTVACTFCSMVHDLSAPATGPAVHVTQIDLTGPARAATRIVRRIALSFALLVILGAASAVLVPLYFYRSAMPQALRGAVTPRPLIVPMSELARSDERGWRQVEAQDPPGGWNRFDPVAGVSWATGIAREWAPDATLTRIDLERAAADGTVDLEGGQKDTVRYRFVSPRRIAEWSKTADVQANAEATYGLFLQVAQRTVTASLQHGRPPADAAPASVQSLPLKDVLARARTQKAFLDRPYYSGYLIPLPAEGWVWYFQPLAGRESLPRVRARDGRVFPTADLPCLP